MVLGLMMTITSQDHGLIKVISDDDGFDDGLCSGPIIDEK